MSDVNDPCLACEIVAGRVCPTGGVIARVGGLVVHGFAEPSPLRGWMVVTSERHVRAWDGLAGEELSALGPLVAKVIAAQKHALGAEHSYAFAIGDQLKHFHLHVIPRFADTPARLRGRGAFESKPEDHLPIVELEAAAERVRSTLEATGVPVCPLTPR
jgi:diadenosine tetraphosphate (Ap4A) HIT family hydrolase